MLILRNYQSYNLNQGSAIAIGNFDCLHLGHQSLIKYTVDYAKKHHLKSGVVTFCPHPRVFFDKTLTAYTLSNIRTKINTLKKMGVDFVVLQKFDTSFSRLSAQEFFKGINESLNVKHISVGTNFKFGYKRQGNIDTIKEWSSHKNIDCNFMVNGGCDTQYSHTHCSTSNIRQMIIENDFAQIPSQLGNHLHYCGRVIHGLKLGRKLDFPTLNVACKPHFLLHGVYVVTVDLDGKNYKGVANVGVRPSLHGSHKKLIEVFLFDFNQDCYGKIININFLHKLRDEINFNSLEELKQQMTQDCKEAKDYFYE